ncbi:MAG: RnfABCDGE type electron transport complex subunit G [Clostridioides sp.]|jgi:electron transport complex protein RnfG|nr:RnfABCDGE type electron transport complex subunit G [Clostridioides sp.]
MKNMVKLGLTLLIICVIASLALGVTDKVTSPVIADRAVQANNELRKTVLPSAKEFNEIDSSEYKGQGGGIIAEVYEGIDDAGNTVGYTVKALPSGYGGAVEVMIGLSKEGKVTGISTGNMSETPGLGSKAAEPDFQEQFKGKETAKPLEVVKGSVSANNQIQAISGATITSTAVTNGTNAAIEVYNSVLVNK